ncbi:hypothetical protein K470DRAFT_267300 [Piedraia hortae CBS 480.64]|uniref:C2H2-type domain-containing protein n=1 Tax=Piedraia hortae CBS 480.64 TaxID=1314780 RepID=A0A6A7CC29_9PEZI|nr:hypothetical protein K470DRAFT_267300 [Piedraia hortae CBS 480.64]
MEKRGRRAVKEPDRRFHCGHGDCDKAYSRAEHLYRHQLNHAPKQIYLCDHPGCARSFVRADLRARHKERHAAKGSQLQRKDAFRAVSATVPSQQYTVEPTYQNHAVYLPSQLRPAYGFPSDQQDWYLDPAAGSMPVFGTSFSPSACSLDDVFLSSLLATEQAPLVLEDAVQHQFYTNYGYDPAGIQPNMGFHPASIQTDICEAKRQRLVDLIASWPEIHPNPGRWSKADILSGDSAEPHHVLSTSMFRHYLLTYWVSIHCQMPILHQPTFNAESCPDLLLLAMICLGATASSTHSTELSFFVAHHTRWEVFRDAEFRPPAKLWTFQALLLLELFEKMFSTHALHERAHVHHATLLAVMRRGSSLVGRCTENTSSDPTRTPPGPDGSINTAGTNTADAAWNRWITAEATRRAAFAAFILDATHATLFGHSAAMAPHELRLPLPCDESLWSAPSKIEVTRIEDSLNANGVKPIYFVEGLKKTLNGHRVRVDTFARTALIAGVLNVAFHLRQRDVQASSLGSSTATGENDWREALTLAVETWKSLSPPSSLPSSSSFSDSPSASFLYDASGATACWYTLARMSFDMEISDLLVFAGAERVLGRQVTSSDREAMRKKMHGWAHSARAREVVLTACRWLNGLLILTQANMDDSSADPSRVYLAYSATSDHVLNRPYVLFFATLLVWAYGFALDGVLGGGGDAADLANLARNGHFATNQVAQVAADFAILSDVRNFLFKMSQVRSSSGLAHLTGRNQSAALLRLVGTLLRELKWELGRDSALVLDGCLGILFGKHG